jgi:hypothetical protein
MFCNIGIYGQLIYKNYLAFILKLLLFTFRQNMRMHLDQEVKSTRSM